MRKSWDKWIAQGCPPVYARMRSAGPKVTPEQMHEELLNAGWTYEGLRPARRFGQKTEQRFYRSPTGKVGAFICEAYAMNKIGGMDV